MTESPTRHLHPHTADGLTMDLATNATDSEWGELLTEWTAELSSTREHTSRWFRGTVMCRSGVLAPLENCGGTGAADVDA